MTAGMAEVISAVNAVRSLHYADEPAEGAFPVACADGTCEHQTHDCPGETVTPCHECSLPDVYYIQWPCETIKALEGIPHGVD